MSSYILTESAVRKIVRETILARSARIPLTTELAARTLTRLNESLGEIAYLDGGKFSGQTTGNFAVSPELAKVRWSVAAIDPTGAVALLSAEGGNNQPLPGSSTSLGNEVNASGQAQAGYFRLKFPLKGSQIYFGSGKFDREKAYIGLIKSIRDNGPRMYALVSSLRFSATGRTASGDPTSAYKKYLEEPVGELIDTALDLTSLAGDIATAFPPTAAVGQAVSLSASGAQIVGKAARGNWIGLLCDVIGLVPAVGKGFELLGKRLSSFLDKMPSAVPLAVADEFIGVSNKIMANFFTKSMQSATQSIVASQGLVSDVSGARKDPRGLAEDGIKILNKHGVAGVIYLVLTKLGVKDALSAVSNIHKALASLVKKVSAAIAKQRGSTSAVTAA